MISREDRRGVSRWSVPDMVDLACHAAPMDLSVTVDHDALFVMLCGPESRPELIGLIRWAEFASLSPLARWYRRRRPQTAANRKFLMAVVKAMGDSVVDPSHAKNLTRQVVHQFTRDLERTPTSFSVKWVNKTHHFFKNADISATGSWRELTLTLLRAGLHAERVRERLSIRVRYGPDVQRVEHVQRDEARWKPSGRPSWLARHRNRAPNQRTILSTRPTRGPNSTWMANSHPGEFRDRGVSDGRPDSSFKETGMLSIVTDVAPYAVSATLLTIGVVVRALSRRTPATRFENTRDRAVRRQMRGKLSAEQLDGICALLNLRNPHTADEPLDDQVTDEPAGQP